MFQGDVIGRIRGLDVADTAMRRKLAAAQKVGLAEGGPGADRAWRLSFARAANSTMALVSELGRMSADRRTLAELLDLCPERGLIAVLEGPSEGLGILALSPPVLAGMIEMQTMGRVSPQPPVARKPTRTDAAMVAGFIDRALEDLETSLAFDNDLTWAGGFRYASFLDDPRPLGLLLDDVPYRVLAAEVSLSKGAKAGPALLALPAEGRGKRPAIPKAPAPGTLPAEAFVQALTEQIMASQSQLQAVLHRVTIPLSAVMGLKPGDLMPLPMAAIDRIVIEGLDGRTLAQGKLGQNRGMRAVRLIPAAGAAETGERPALRAVAAG
jgi:flagellar motor switch protein FliM